MKTNNVKEVHAKILENPPFLSLVILNWNRFELLRGTVLSLIANTYCNFEMFIIDNASTDFSVPWLKLISEKSPKIKPIFLTENKGGEALNLVFEKLTGEFILFSENDLEYLPNWDINMITPFFIFENLGQISPFSPSPQENLGEIWTQKAFTPFKKGDVLLNVAAGNLGTTSLVRKTIIDRGVKWINILSENTHVKFPSDTAFSQQIRDLGYILAWSNEYQVINWGHNKNIIRQNPDYYYSNWKAKAENNIDGLKTIENNSLGLDATNIENTSAENLIEQIKNVKIEFGLALQELDDLKRQVKSYKIKHPDADLKMVVKEKTTLYIDIGNDFNPNLVVRSTIDPSHEAFELHFNLTDFDKIKRLRWDPIEGYNCQVRLNEIQIHSKKDIVKINLNRLSTNSARRNKEWWVFDTFDPMFIIEELPKQIHKIIISGQWKII
jgi:glycosyltransferase involved in cell wall biosynthesis